jgi:hypothetical protein
MKSLHMKLQENEQGFKSSTVSDYISEICGETWSDA